MLSASRHLFVRRWEVPTEIPQRDRAQKRVDHGVGEHIGVGVSLQSLAVRDAHPAQDQRPPDDEAMRVEPVPHPKRQPAHDRLHTSDRHRSPAPLIPDTPACAGSPRREGDRSAR